MTTGSRVGLAIVIVVAMLSHANAQTAEAEALFREGKRLLKQGEIAAACEKLEASEKLEPENGTELNLADCWERIGKTASAWAMFVKAEQSAKREDRAAEARRRAALLEKQLVYLTIRVPDEVAIEDLEIKRNDQRVDRASWNQRVPVDPDEYKIVARAPKHEKWTTTIKIKSKDKVVVVPALEPRKRGKRRDDDDAPERPNENAKLALGLGIGGAGAIAIASLVAYHSKGLQDRSDAVCPTTICGDANAVDLNRRARREAWIANVGWGVGVVAIGAAIIVWSIGEKTGDDAPAVTISPVLGEDRASLVLGGRF